MRVGAQLLLTFLLNATWQIALIVAFAAACDWLLRGTAARYRYAVWVAALGLAFFLPLLSPARMIATRWTSKEQPARVSAAPVFVTWIYSPDLDSVEPVAQRPVPAAEPAHRNFLTSGISLNLRLALGLVTLYGLLLVYRAGQLLRAWRRTKRIVRTAYDCEFSTRVNAIVEHCQTVIGVERVRILCSASVPVPITVGVWRPFIILPHGLLQDMDDEVLTSAFGHELVHVARRDYFANLIYEFIYLPLSFHPAVMLLRRRIKQTRELCCDEAVASKLLGPETYARSLVRLIGSAPIVRRPAMDTTIGISESDILEVRIMSLLKKTKLTVRRKRLLLISAALLLAAPCVAAASFALNFEIDRQEPKVAQSSPQKADRENLVQMRDTLKRAMNDLKEQARVAPESQRAEIDARLLEVQRNLELHNQALREYYGQRESAEKSIQELRETLAQLEKTQPADEARLKETRDKIAEMTKRLELQKSVDETQGQSGDRRARVIYRVEPEYTQDARENKIAGSVLLALTIDADGLPQNIQVKRSLYPSLDRSAIEAAKKMRFEPALKDGKPVSQTISVEMHFAVEPGQYDPQRAAEDRRKRELEERGQMELTGTMQMRRSKSLDERNEERSRVQAELTQAATLSMDRAIQIATSQVPGKVLACSLGRDGDKVFYHVVIITPEQVSANTKDGAVTLQTNTATYVWVSATDGQILKTEKEERRERSSIEREQGAPISGGVLNGKTTSMPIPAYPEIARAAHASGAVNVEVTVDETGHVVMAHAVSGHPLLQAAAVTAARGATFPPTRLSGEPVKVTGVLVYNFVAQ
jgi:TonB family protein